MTLPVAFLPGAFKPAASSYGRVLRLIEGRVVSLLKDLELCAAGLEPAGYSLALEVEGLARAADRAGFRAFHLVGYSAGGAVALAFVAAHPARARSLCLVEPSLVGRGVLAPDSPADLLARERVLSLPASQRLQAFIPLTVGPQATLATAHPRPPAALAARQGAALLAFERARVAYEPELERLREFGRPVHVAVGSLSHPRFARMAASLARLFPDVRVEVYPGRHHFDPPHRSEPARFAAALQDLWRRAEGAPTVRSAGAAVGVGGARRARRRIPGS